VIKTIAWRGRLIPSVFGAAALLTATGLKPATRPIAEKPALIAERPTESGGFPSSVLLTWRKFPLALGHTRSLAASGCNGCLVRVSIVAVQGAKLIGPDAPPEQTQLRAWINNLGAYPTMSSERLPSFRPSTEATYAEIADRDPATGKTRWQILEFPVGVDQAARVVAAGNVRSCHRNTPDRAMQSEADFKVCGRHISNDGALDAPCPCPCNGCGQWYACPTGCCT
jgi:hypothetical protein